MRCKLLAVAGACLAAAAFTLPGIAGAGPALAATPPSASGQPPGIESMPANGLPREPAGTRDCAAPASPLMMRCQSLVATSATARSAARAAADAVASARARGKPVSATVTSSGPLTPQDLQAAYGVASASSSDGYGEIVAIVDAYYDPGAQADLAAYRSDFGLLRCGADAGYPEAGCLNVYNQNGVNLATDPSAAPPQSPGDDNWVPETSLDMDMVSAICPNCTIDLIEADSPLISDLATAEDTAVSLGARFVSNSWSGGDYPGESEYDTAFDHPGVAIVFASGDNGYGASYPASSQFVTSVGGTYLDRSGSGRWTSTVWNDNGSQNTDGIAGATASGCAAGEPEPSWGPDSVDSTASDLCANRTQNDVSAVADAPSGVDIYDAADCGGYCDAYGTSAATPVIAAMYALAGTPEANTYPASYLYQDPSGLTPVTSGDDVLSGSPLTCESSRRYLCDAADSLSSPYKGYNGPAGLGTPNGDLAPFREARTGDIVSVANPGTYDLQQGVYYSLPAIQAHDSAPRQALTFSAAGLPAGLSLNPATGVISGSTVYAENDTVRVTATDGTGASATVSFRIEASPSLTASYRAGTGQIRLNWDSKCMDDTSDRSGNGNKIQIWQCLAGDAGQVWSFLPDSTPGNVSKAGLSQTGTVRINGKCLNIVDTSATGDGTADGAKLQLWACNGGSNEQWEISGGFGQLINPASGKCVDDPYSSKSNGTQLDIWSCNDEQWQAWELPASPITSGVGGKCLDDTNDSGANGNKVQSWACNGYPSQKLVIGLNGEIRVSGKCLNAAGNGTINGTPVQLWTCSGAADTYPANYWYLTAYGQIENAQAQKCLAIPGNSSVNGVKLVLQDCYGEPGEIWAVS